MTPVFVIAPQASGELAEKVAALMRPATYPEHPAGIDAIETHMSWVFRTPQHAYKLKKPIRSGFLDFSTIEARRQSCDEEVRLNRRLAPQVYLGVVPLARTATGALHLGCDGAIVDWLVQMRRLPEARMLGRLIETGKIDDAALQADGDDAVALRAAACLLAHFYAGLPSLRPDPRGQVDAIATDIEQAWHSLGCERYALPREPLARAATMQRELLDRLRPLIESRAASGRIVEGHGDLRPEHVFLLDSGPVVIDCLEFNRALRTLDPADDLGFLALECERLGLTSARTLLFDTYRRIARDEPPDALVHGYQSYRATLRAKLAAWHLDEPRYRNGGHWRDRAMHYVALAQSHAALALEACTPSTPSEAAATFRST